MVNLERIHKDFARITSDNVDPGGVYTPYNHEISLLPHIPCTAWVGKLGRIHEDFARITSDNVDPGGSIDGQCGKDL